MKLTEIQIKLIESWLVIQAKVDYTRSQREHSYRRWAKGGKGWNPIRQGGSGIMLVLCWYHHYYKVNSAEWRPKIIINQLLIELTPKKQ